MDDPTTTAFLDRYAPLYGGRDVLLDALNMRPRRGIRLNRLKTTPDARAELAEALEAKGALAEPIPWWKDAWMTEAEGVGNFVEHVLGYAYVQEPASMLPPLALDPQPGERVLDMCASPGSKTTQIGELMDDRGLLWANEKDKMRADWLVWNLQRWGITSALVTRGDGRRLGGVDDGFDRILVDAPCSGLGSYNLLRGPIRNWSPAMSKSLAHRQLRLLEQAYRLVKPGGVVVYSTCTVEPLENEDVCTRFLARADARIEPHGLPVSGVPVVADVDGAEVHVDVQKHALRLHRDGGLCHDFFVARFRKPEDSAAARPIPERASPADYRDSPHDRRSHAADAEERAHVRDTLAKDYSLDVGPGAFFTSKRRVYLSRADVDLERVRDLVIRVGLHLATPESGGLRLTVDGAQRFTTGIDAIEELSDADADAWLAGEAVTIPGDTGFFALQKGAMVMGAGFRGTDDRIMNTLRRSRQVPPMDAESSA